MKQMTSLPIVALILPLGNCWRSLSLSYFTGPRLVQQRSFARQSPIWMMPEGPEVRKVVDQLQEGVGRRLIDIQFLSGRYVRHGRPYGFAEFANTMTPTSVDTSLCQDGNTDAATDIIKDWNAKGKFIYITLDRDLESSAKDNDASDFLRSIWVTLGMTGQFVSEKVHESDPRYARWYLEMMDVESRVTHRVYYHDQRNFGTLKFSTSREELTQKLARLGPDVLDRTTTVEAFLHVASAQRPAMNICKFLMDQSKIAGVGNYILSECLYRATIDPFASIGELDETMLRNLFAEIQAVANESYAAQGLTRRAGGTFRSVEGRKGGFEFQLQCYGRERCAKGDTVIKETQGPHKRTIWYTTNQLFMPREARDSSIEVPIKTSSFSSSESSSEDNSGKLVASLLDNGWKNVLSDAIKSDSFQALERFIDDERASGAQIYPPQSDIFSAFNLCPFDKVKVVIVGQDPYHGPGQGHGLAFSVRHHVTPPPSLKNIFREATDDLGINVPEHGNLESWARQGVLLVNCVLSVRRGEANSHKGRGWEEFTDSVISAIDKRSQHGVVFLLWGNPAAKKAKNVDESKHVVIRTSHPSPLGATKTKSPFLGSRCFSRTNEALLEMGQTPINWNVDTA